MADYEAVGSLVGLAARQTAPKVSFFDRDEVNGPRSPLSEDVFERVLMFERRRAERSRRTFALMLINSNGRQVPDAKVLRQVLAVLATTSRESDLIGWYEASVTIGVIFTEIEDTKTKAAASILRKVEAAVQDALGQADAAKISISMHMFPEDGERGGYSGKVADSKLYPDLRPRASGKQLRLGVKRAIDIGGSALLLLLTLPLLATIAAIIKLTSKGPVLFTQERLGQFGQRFKCLKFRTMYVDCDPKIHREYVQQFIAGNGNSAHEESSQKNLYKLTHDPRITPFGRFLRKSSLDEFPQFWNVLRGEMSLVGPRPPVPYEFEVYDVWHRRRVLELKPGVTGLWQVSGRNRIPFQEMVRLDLRYSQKWSLWLDFKILIATPWAVFSGDCA
jgi:lipopolysaccharide/colanic/teichoic acid biosynthesis glycosyltransferase